MLWGFNTINLTEHPSIPKDAECVVFVFFCSRCPEDVFLGGFLLRFLIQVEKVTSWVTASLMLHEFRAPVMDAWSKWSLTENPILTKGRFSVICRDTAAGSGAAASKVPVY